MTHEFTVEEFTDREVVARIRSAMPYYDMAPRLVTDVARRLPVGPDFLTFHLPSPGRRVESAVPHLSRQQRDSRPGRTESRGNQAERPGPIGK